MKIFSYVFKPSTYATTLCPIISTLQRTITPSTLKHFAALKLDNLSQLKLKGDKAIGKKELLSSPIRTLNIGKNYFRYTNPRRKKNMMTLLNSYFKHHQSKQHNEEIILALDLFYNQENNGKRFDEFTEVDLKKINESVHWHFYMLMLLDRIATQYSRYEFMEYDQFIKSLNAIKKSARNKGKYIFTADPNQPNSLDQIQCISEIFKALEENDLEYLDHAMCNLCQANKKREFKSPSPAEESYAYHLIGLPKFIEALGYMYELGLKDLSDFFETPGTWISFNVCKDQEVGLMTYTHAINILFTLDEYMKIIDEAECKLEMKEIISYFDQIREYATHLIRISLLHKEGKLSKLNFFSDIPMINLNSIAGKIIKRLTEIAAPLIEENSTNLKRTTCAPPVSRRLSEINKKLLALFEVFKLNGCVGQLQISSKELSGDFSQNGKLMDSLREISVLNNNLIAVDMVVLDDPISHNQCENLKKLMSKFNLTQMQIVPLIRSQHTENYPISKLDASKKRQKDGLLLTEITGLEESLINPNGQILLCQGNTAERGGGPFTLTHQKYNGMTQIQRQRHIRTVQGHHYTSEFCSKDLLFTFLLSSAKHINMGDHFTPTQGYLDFLKKLDTIIGQPQRQLRESEEFNDVYANNPYVQTLSQSFNYAGQKAQESGSKFNISEEIDVNQAYIFSDRCSFTHPELAYWERLDEQMIKRMARYYYDNNRHFKYILYTYGFMIKRYDLEFAKKIGIFGDKEQESKVLQSYTAGKAALEKILENMGLGSTSTPMKEIFNQHLGLLTNSTQEECDQKLAAYLMLNKLQMYSANKWIENNKKNITKDEDNLKKIKILQSALANISPFNGKG